MIQSNNSGNKIKENKYKILRMSLLLGNGEAREETIKNFEDASREIDAMNDEIYAKDLEGKFYDTNKLEEEEKKLEVLVDCIGGRVEQRMSLLDDFLNVTGYELTNLPEIKYSDKLEEYKNRLYYIKEYLDNKQKIEKLTKEVDSLENELNSAYVSKAKAEERNKKEEEEISNRFNIIIKRNEEFKEINEENAEYKLSEIKKETEESKKSLEIFQNSYATLEQAGISGEEREEYLSYVNGAKKVYYSNKELEYLVRLFIIFNEKKFDYNQIISKRNTIRDILSERLTIRETLKAEKEDCLYNIYSILDRQYKEINEQKENIDRIEKLNSEIEERKELAAELEKDNQKVEILSLLKEFGIIDTYETEDLEENDYTEDNEDISIDNQFQESSYINDNIEADENDEQEEIETNIESEELRDSKPEIDSTIEINNSEEPTKEIEEPKEEIENISDSNDNVEELNVEDNQVVSVNDVEKINIQEAIEKSNSVMRRVGEMLGVKIETPIEKTDASNVEAKEDNIDPQPISDNKEESITESNNDTETPDIAISTEENNNTTPEENNTIEDNTSNLFFDKTDDNITAQDTTSESIEISEQIPQPQPVEQKEESEPADFDITSNIFLNNNFDADPETNIENTVNQQPTTSEQSQPQTPSENPLFNNELANKTLDDVMASNQNIDENKNDDFWFSQEETPLDLNSLPDINSSPEPKENQEKTFFGNGEAQTLDFPNLGEQLPTEKEVE